ncbi:signal recognition particle receptor subunit alpha [Acrasis kona]|uniref:Signal recognition particle receptor subunit alpha n=1 Tax=Acrasis kona TaxID=1008807 RepID=A0AAW2Z576_9EUKA
MIEEVAILTKGGLILWKHTEKGIRGNPINTLIRNVLLEDRISAKSYETDHYTLKWTLANDVDLIFVIVYANLVQTLYSVEEEVLEIVRDKFIDRYKALLLSAKLQGQYTLSESLPFKDFGLEYRNIVRAVEKRASENKEARKVGDTLKEAQAQANKDKSSKNVQEPSREVVKDEPAEQVEEQEDVRDSSAPMSKFDILMAKGVKPKNARPTKTMKTFPPKKDTPPRETVKHAKQNTSWSDQTYTSDRSKRLDMSKKDPTADPSQKMDQFRKSFLPDPNAVTDIEGDIIQEGGDDDEEDFDINDYKKKQVNTSGEPVKKSTWSSLFATLTNNRTLDESDLEPVMGEFKKLLQSKNVASEIADGICKSVEQSLIGKKLGAFQAVKTSVNEAMDEALTRILTPKRNIDVLRDANNARDVLKRPYVMTFCGVNGVGKSTSLSKICFWLQQNKLKVLLAACDTFRSGAVEQLKVHASCLGVEVYHEGYGKEPALVARDAIAYAKKNKIDVVLVDTAGRMADNEPLMRKLATLIQMNRPDIVLFVGEALVGNDGVDQLQKFNDSLGNLSTSMNTEQEFSASDGYVNRTTMIDGIVLTKFDTIDDKVGAAISMVYKTGHPIVFVGVGQTYTDLKKLSVRSVVKSLMK